MRCRCQPIQINPDRPMSGNCSTAALRAIGYSGAEMSWHGFRAPASTLDSRHLCYLASAQ